MDSRQWGAVAVVVVVILSVGGVGLRGDSVARAQATPEIDVGSSTVGAGETGTLTVSLSDVPNGLTGYRIVVSLDDPDVANVTNASIPGAFQPPALRSATVADDNGSVVLKATDALRNVEPGATDVTLGEITVEGAGVGRTDVTVEVDLVQDDRSPPRRLAPSVTAGSVTVEGPNGAPTADAGADRSVNETATVTLDAGGSTDPDDDALSFAWVQRAGPDVTLSAANTSSPTFTAPAVASETDLVFELAATDGEGGSDTDGVTVTVAPVEDPPAADAGDDRAVVESNGVELDATDSADPEGESLSYAWRQTGGPNVTLDGDDTARPSFTAPDVAVSTTLAFEVTVTDGEGLTDADDVSVTVSPGPEPNDPPTAEAGSDAVRSETENVTLDATGSTDSDGDTLLYAWEQTAGPDVTLVGGTTARPSFTAPDVAVSTTLAFEVTVTDGDGGTDTDSVSVTVTPQGDSGDPPTTDPDPPSANEPPTADAGTDRRVAEGATVELDAGGSTDPDGDVVTHNWTQTDGPTVGLSNPLTTTPTFTAPAVETPTTLTFRTRARDGKGGTDADDVTVTIVPTNDPPAAEAGPETTVPAGSSVELNASGSTDPNGDALSFAWRQITDATLRLDGGVGATASFTAPDVDERTRLVFEVTVSDAADRTDADTVNVLVTPPESDPADENRPPVADSGANRTVAETTAVTLDAGDSSDPDDETLRYAWTQTAGPDVDLSDPNSTVAKFEAPGVDAPTDLTFSVAVADDDGGRDTDAVTVTVEPAPAAEETFEVTDLDAPTEVRRGETVTVSGTVTNTGDADGTQSIEVRADLNGDGTAETVRTVAITLPEGANETVTVTRTVPETLSPGTHAVGLWTDDDERTAAVTVVSTSDGDSSDADGDSSDGEGDSDRYTRDEISQAKYGYDFADLSTETSRQVEELFLRQPFPDGHTPADVLTREQLAKQRYGVDFDELGLDETVEIQSAFDAQFGDTGAAAANSRDEISQAKYGYDFADLSTETSGQVEELYDRQPFADGVTAESVRTREQIANAEYGANMDELTLTERLDVEQTYHDQFAADGGESE